MIQVTIVRRSLDNPVIEAFLVEGHAQYDEPGKDLVCAAVSAITVGAVNSVEKLTGTFLLSEMEKGLLDVTVPELNDPAKNSKVQLLIESMIVMLQTIEDTYGKYIAIHTKTHGKGG